MQGFGNCPWIFKEQGVELQAVSWTTFLLGWFDFLDLGPWIYNLATLFKKVENKVKFVIRIYMECCIHDINKTSVFALQIRDSQLMGQVATVVILDLTILALWEVCDPRKASTYKGIVKVS